MNTKEFFQDQHARELGFTSFKHYLQSDLWKFIKNHVFNVKGRKCIYCGKKATKINIEFSSVDGLAGNNIDRLMPSCHACMRDKPREMNIVIKPKNTKKHRAMEQDRKYHEEQAKKWAGYTKTIKKKSKPVEIPVAKLDKLAIMVSEAQENREFYADEAEKWL